MSYPKKRYSTPACDHYGISLIEILIAIAVITILAGLLFPLSSSISHRIYQITCAANLRSIGTAIHSYANDHGGRLPGPGPGGIGASYTVVRFDDPRNLAHFLLPYLDAPVPAPGQTLLLKTFVCPASLAYLEGGDLTHGKSYSQVPSRTRGVPNIADEAGNALYPFGYKAGADPESWHDAPYLSQIQRPADTFAVLDRRNLAPGIDSAHRGYRNILFLDGHVQRVPLEQFISIGELHY